MRHIHTSIVSRHLARRGNDKILCTPHHILADLKIYFPASLVAPLPISEQINHPSLNHTYTKSMPNHTHHRYSSSHTRHMTHIIPSTTPIHAPEQFVDHKREDRTPLPPPPPPPLARVNAVVR